MTTQKGSQQPREEEKIPLVHIVRKRDTKKRNVGNCTLSWGLGGMIEGWGKDNYHPAIGSQIWIRGRQEVHMYKIYLR